ncbi:hypothetical protein [Halorussus halophilus]|uniref:hypothetical protein n=1 Tax=Halorussus halophilus TaxID=2650975 RepID=UPI001300D0BC|nr:hypothetical protein [Halorussus halophilus]
MNWSSFLTFYVGVMLFFATFATGIGALEYEVVASGPIDYTPHELNGFGTSEVRSFQYDKLDPRDQRIVDSAIAGDRLVFRAPGNKPTGVHQGDFVVRRDGNRYLVEENLFFNYETKFAAASGGFALLGLCFVGKAVQWEHC